MRYSLTTALLLIASCLQAQKNIRFASQNSVGIVSGQHGLQYQLETINGIRTGQWFAAAGIAIDGYKRTTIPLFLSLDRQILKKGTGSLFINVQGGLNLPLQKRNYYNEWGYKVEKRLAGTFWQAGLGYRLGMRNVKHALAVEAGYRIKSFSEKLSDDDSYILTPFNTARQSAGQIKYHFRMLSVRIGWEF